jgi:hypothetical protein
MYHSTQPMAGLRPFHTANMRPSRGVAAPSPRPKSVSLLRALTDDIADKAIQAAHQRAIAAAMAHLHQHARFSAQIPADPTENQLGGPGPT